MKWIILLSFLSVLVSRQAIAFCGFYVAKADTKIFNKASKVVMVRDGKRTVLSLMNDFQGELKNFAMVVPVPTVLKKGQIHIGKKAHIDRVDAFTAPRLAEYFDEDPCAIRLMKKRGMVADGFGSGEPPRSRAKEKGFGVKVEAEYQIGEYDIVILSAKESDGLEKWLLANNYKIPKGASEALAPYIKQKMKFFVAKVNLKEQAKTGLSYLRPLQFAFESEKFMLPIRLGMVNANGPQELFVFVLTKKGRVETTNYRTVKLPSNMDIPVYIKDDFASFYKAMFDNQVKKEDMRAVFTEYFWDMSWCDPCAANPLTPEELRGLGVFWVGGESNVARRFGKSKAQPVKVTRLHVRYTKKTFPDDMMFQETGDTRNFQGRYVLRHPWTGKSTCDAAKNYKQNLPKRFEKEAQTLANLTGWDINDIRKKMSLKLVEKKPRQQKESWWDSLWGKDS